MKKNKLEIVYEDKDIIAVNKKSGLLTIATLKEKEKTLYHYVSEYEKQKNKNNKIFVVHRLDKDTSGIVVFAKNIKSKNILQNNWDKVLRKYYAIVKGKTMQMETLVSFLKENEIGQVYTTENEKIGKKAITVYRQIKYTNNYSLLDVQIFTGRKHQIRVQLNDIGHGIVGDKKYSRIKASTMYLCAYFLEFNHPKNGKKITLEIKMPKEFENIM